MSDIRESEKRVFQQMSHLLRAYERQEITLSRLIGGLEALLTLVVADAEWKQSFLAQWGRLEDIESVRLYENRAALKPEESENILLSLRALADLITRAKGEAKGVS